MLSFLGYSVLAIAGWILFVLAVELAVEHFFSPEAAYRVDIWLLFAPIWLPFAAALAGLVLWGLYSLFTLPFASLIVILLVLLVFRPFSEQRRA